MISVIIPTLNEANNIERTLNAVFRLSGNFEVILVDGGSKDHTVEIAKSFSRVKIITSQKGRSFQMNRGAEIAKGHVLLFLHADTLLPPNAFSAIDIAMSIPENVAGSFFLDFDYRHRWLTFYTACSKINNALFTYGDHAIFIKKSCFESIGGYEPIPFMEDVEIQSRLRRSGKFIKLPLGVITSARRFEKSGVVKQCMKDFFLILFYKAGVSPFKLKEYYKDHVA